MTWQDELATAVIFMPKVLDPSGLSEAKMTGTGLMNLQVLRKPLSNHSYSESRHIPLVLTLCQYDEAIE